jgi:V8-like Glu-specific endopeptidase
MLTIIQHPDGNPKKIAAGAKLGSTEQEISYGDVDTRGGASGSGIINQDGRVIGVHTTGGCFDTGGSNSGVTLLGIRRVSKVIK